MFRQRISPPWVCSWSGPFARSGFFLSQKFSRMALSTTSLSLRMTLVRAPIWRILKLFHSPNFLSAKTSGSLPSSRAVKPLGGLAGCWAGADEWRNRRAARAAGGSRTGDLVNGLKVWRALAGQSTRGGESSPGDVAEFLALSEISEEF